MSSDPTRAWGLLTGPHPLPATDEDGALVGHALPAATCAQSGVPRTRGTRRYPTAARDDGALRQHRRPSPALPRHEAADPIGQEQDTSMSVSPTAARPATAVWPPMTPSQDHARQHSDQVQLGVLPAAHIGPGTSWTAHARRFSRSSSRPRVSPRRCGARPEMSDFLERIAKLSPKRLALLAADLQARLDALERAPTEPIAIVGMGCRFPGGPTRPTRSGSCCDGGVDAITEVPRDRWDVDACYDPDPDAPGKMSTRCGGFLERRRPLRRRRSSASRRARPRAWTRSSGCCSRWPGRRWRTPARRPTSLAGSAHRRVRGHVQQRLLPARDRRRSAAASTRTSPPATSHSVAAGRLSYTLGLQGPSLAVDTACSSSLVAVHLACQSLRAGECRLALAGGVNLDAHARTSPCSCRARGCWRRTGAARRSTPRRRLRPRRGRAASSCSSASPTRRPTATASSR